VTLAIAQKEKESRKSDCLPDRNSMCTITVNIAAHLLEFISKVSKICSNYQGLA
jgi:hypothetical protein